MPRRCWSLARSVRRATMRATARRRRRRRAAWCAPAPRRADRERLGDFYLYPLAERTTIADKQTKQVSFLDVHGAPASRGYEYRNGWLGDGAASRSAPIACFASPVARGGGLGDALPAGTVRVYQRDARGNPQFVGEHRDRPHADGLEPRASRPARRSTSRSARWSRSGRGWRATAGRRGCATT